jgi:trk system potassium uptake protein TrkA
MYVLVAGGGHMGTHLVTRLVAEGHDTAVIDPDRQVTDRIFAEHGVVVFNGSATDLTVLEQAGLKRADVAVAMTGRDEANLAFCLLARYFGVPRVLARMLNPQYEVPYRLVGATKIHSEADILVGSFLTSIEYPEIGALMPVGKAELVVFELRLPAAAPVAGKTIAEIVRLPDFPRPCLFIGVETATGLDVADGNTVVQGGTTVLMAARRPDLPRVLRCLTDVGAAGGDPDRGRAIQTLAQVPFLSGLAHDDLNDLLAGSRFERHRKGDTLYEEGQPGDRLYVIASGAVEVETRGRPPVVLRPPDSFGERTALTGQPRTRTVRVLEDAELLVVEGSALRAVVLRNPFLAMELAKALSAPPR